MLTVVMLTAVTAVKAQQSATDIAGHHANGSFATDSTGQHSSGSHGSSGVYKPCAPASSTAGAIRPRAGGFGHTLHTFLLATPKSYEKSINKPTPGLGAEDH